MCGILGISGQLDLAALKAATAAIAHRGPDDTGVFYDTQEQIGLGHTRLSIVDLSPLGHQPMISQDGQVALVFNGEIYNFRELRAELISAGCTFKSQSDTEVVLQLYLLYGHAMLTRLNGIFALGLWDANRKGLLLARDALGVKPLYVYEGNGSVSFSSEIKALLHLTPSLDMLDHVAIHRYLSFQWCPGSGTPFTAIKKLGPGEGMWIEAGKVQERFRWYCLPVFTTKKIEKMTQTNAVAGVVSYLRQAVHRQMMADVPVGAFLSGGLDSSSIVAFAKEVNPKIKCFTIESAGGQESGMTDDLGYAKRVASHLNVPLEIVSIDSSRMAADLEEMIFMLDEPLADPAPLNVLYISRLARENGMKVLLSGAGGDDIFSGYRRHLALSTERYWNWLPQGVRASLEQGSARLDQRVPLFRKVTKLFNGAALSGDARIINYFLWARRADLYALYTPEFRAAAGDKAAEAPMTECLASMPASASSLDRMLALEQRFFLPDHNLTYTDKMSMATGVEVRVPFLDLDLANFAAQIPDGFKQQRGHNKWVFKKAMEPYLPKDVIYRPKTGFGAPLRRWMRYELREMLGDLLSTDSLKRRGLFEPTAVQSMITANDLGQKDASYTLLSLLCIEIWCRQFIDRSPSTQQRSRSE
jgi:asparagine synthase (glutamine-hydrolysing)